MTTKTLPNSTTTTYYYAGSGVTLVNNGVQGRPGASGMNFGFVISGNNDTLVNNGTAFGQRSGIYGTGSGDGIINAAGGQIIATYSFDGAVNFNLFVGTLTNFGTISGYAGATNGNGGNAVQLQQGGLVTNFGTLQGGGVLIRDSLGTVVNSGVILGNVAYGGVYMSAGGTVTNLTGGLISSNGATESYRGGPPYGVSIAGGVGTVTNAGTIDGGSGYAVLLATGFQNRVVVDPGAVFLGTVDGGTAVDATLELASKASQGTLSGIGTQFINFGTLAFDPSASWRVNANTAIASTTITGFGATDTIDLSGFLAVSDTFSANTLVLTNASSAHVTLHMQGSFTTANFTIGSDGSGGTDLGYSTIAPADLIYGQTIDDTGIVATSETVTAGTMTLFNGASQVDQISVGTSLSSGDFILRSDGSGGTDVILDTVFGIYNSGVTLLTNPTTIAAAARVINSATNGKAVTGPTGTNWTLVNQGVVSGTASGGIGVSLAQAGTIINAAGGTIAGNLVDGNGRGISLAGGGVVSNASGGTIIGAYGIQVSGAAGTVRNQGYIDANGHGAPQGVDGVYLKNGGTVVNGAAGGTVSTARISSYAYTRYSGAGVKFGATGTDTLINYGAIYAQGGYAVRMTNGTVINGPSGATGAYIKASGDTALSFSGAGTVVNYGTIRDGNAQSGGSGNPRYYGVVLANGGIVTNLGSASLIEGYVGVYGKGGVTVTNAGTIEANTPASGVYLEPAAVMFGTGANRLIVDPGAVFAGPTPGMVGLVDGVGTSGTGTSTLEFASTTATGTVSGFGTQFINFPQITFDAGANWLISGVNSIASGVTLTNSGTDTVTGTLVNTGLATGVSEALLFGTGGHITNQSGGTIAGTGHAVVGVGAGTFVNAGEVSGNDAIYLVAGGSITNQSGGTISGTGTGIKISSTTGTVSNQSGGTITGYVAVEGNYIPITVTNAGAITGTGEYGFAGFAGGSVTNLSTGSISGHDGVAVHGTVGSVRNAGGIGGNTNTGTGILFTAGGVVTNQSGGTITGDIAVYITGAAGTVVNTGAITGNIATFSSNGIVLKHGGAVTNQSGGTISGHYGIYFSDAAVASLTNAGAIVGNSASGSGVFIGDGGTFSNVSGGTITGYHGIMAENAAATVVNAGSLGSDGDSFAVYLRHGGAVTNQSGGIVTGYNGVQLQGGSGTVVNTGQISGDLGSHFAAGAELTGGGAVTNQSGGTIAGYTGVYLVGAANVTNAGSIGGNTISGAGVYFESAGTLTNQSGGVISGGGDAVRFASGTANRLVIDPGAVFSGSVDGANAIGAGSVSTLELGSGASTGTLSGFGSQYINFAQVTLDAGAQWDIVGGDATTALAGATITGFTYGDTIDVTNFAAIGDSFSSNHLTLTNGGGTITLDIPGSFLSSQFRITNDGGSGTDITLGLPTLLYGDTIDEAGIVATSETVTGGVMTLSDGGSPVGTIEVGGTLNTSDFTLSPDGSSGTDVIVSTVFGTYTSGVTLLTNPTTIASTATVSNAATGGKAVSGPAGTNWTVVNQGLVSETAASGIGINLAQTGTVINASGGLITAAAYGVILNGGGLVSNASGGTIGAINYGVTALAAATVVNAGEITASLRGAVFLGQGGAVTNQFGGVIAGQVIGVGAHNAAATVVNAGDISVQSNWVTISGNSFTPEGILLADGGSATNLAGGTISGMYGIVVQGAAGSVVNAGAISAANGSGIYLGAGGSAGNQSGGTITAKYGVVLTKVAATLVNAGDISASDQGVYIGHGGLVSNQSGGTITGVYGVYVGASGTAATVINAGQILAASGIGILLSQGGAITNLSGGTIVGAGGANFGYAAIVGDGAAVTLTNAGVIVGTAGNGTGVLLHGGGLVTNQSGGTIESAYIGVHFSQTAATLVNAGVISGNTAASGGSGVSVSAGGVVTNQSSGTISGYDGVDISGTAGLVQNAGSIGGLGGAGVRIAHGGTITNQSGGTISGATDAVSFASGYTNRVVDDPGSVFSGTVDGGNTIGAGSISTLELASGASAGTLSGLGTQYIDFARVTVDAGASWTIAGTNLVASDATVAIYGSLTNAGTIGGTNAGGTLTLVAGGVVTNLSDGTIAGTTAVYASGVATVVNAGLISGNAATGTGISLSAGGYVTNQSGGSITGDNGVMASGGAATVSNAGYIDGAFGVSLGSGGLVTNQSGGTIVGGTGVYTGYSPGTVLNAGYVKAMTGDGVLIAGGGYLGNQSGGTITGIGGVYLNTDAGSVVNAGTILAQNDAVRLNAGGSITNQAGGTIIGFAGIDLENDAATVVNAGYILARNGGGVQLSAGGYVTNAASGSIGGFFGIFATSNGATVVNAGTISGSDTGIDGATTGSFTNQSGGTIVGVFGIYAGSSITVLNAGLIDGIGSFSAIRAGGTVTNESGGTIESAGGDAVSFESGFTNRLVIDPGATFIGRVDGGNIIGTGSISTLELTSAASAGTLSGLGTTYVDFAQVVVDTGANWVLAGGNTVVAGVTLTNGGTLTDTGTLINYGLITGASQVVLLGTGGLITNQSGGIIEATGTTGAAILGSGAGTVVNAGQIIGGMGGFGGDGISLAVGGSITNQSGGTIAGFDGIYASAASTSILNLGDIAGNATHGTGIVLYAGGTVTNEAGASITGTVALAALGSATVINAGYIADGLGGIAVDLRGGGAVTNQSGGTLVGRAGVYADDSVDVVNGGLIVGTASSGLGIYMYHGGSVTNSSGGTIIGGRLGVGAAAAVAVVNAGIIAGTYGTGIGIDLHAAGTITNQSGGTISGAAGAVAFAGSYTNRLVIDPGAVFSGLVDGGNTIGSGAVSTLELGSGASTGTLSGFGSQYINFAQVTLDAGAQWDIVGGDATTALAGATITGFGYGDTIDVTNFAATGDSFSGNQLTLTNGGGTITLDIPGTFFSSQFRITNDGGGGTDITVQPLTLLYGDTVDEAGIVATSETVTGGVMTLYDGASPVGTIGVGGTLNTSDFILSPDGSSGTDVIVSTVFGTYTNSGVTLLINPTTIAGTASITGTVAYGIGVTGPSGTAWTLVNQGLVSETGTASLGISFASAGTIINAAGGIVAGSEAGIALSAGGSVTNQSGGTISGAQGLYALTGAASVVNAGSIGGSVTLGSGIALDAGGTVTNVAGGTISGSYGVKASGSAATVVNAGSIGDGSSLPTGAAIALKHGGLIVNQSGGEIIAGLLGVYFGGAAGTIVNAGSVAGGISNGEGIIFTTAGAVTNQSGGVITGRYGVRAVAGAVTVVNAGSIGGNTVSGSGVNLSAGGSLTNQFGGVITGQKAVYVAGGTVTNAGSIGGATAVAFGAGSANRLVFDPGAVFSGAVDGGNTIGATAVSTLELASGDAAGTLSGLGTQFADFANVRVDSGARWTLSTTDMLIAGATLTNAGTLTATGTLVNAGTITGNRLGLSGGVLTNQASGVLTVAAVYGVAAGGADTVVNQGMISTGVGAAIYLAASGSITNAAGGVITGYSSAVNLGGAVATLNNLGQITATQEIGSYGVYLKNGGLIINGQAGTGTSTALIQGYYGVASKIAAGTLDNYGTILGEGGRAVDLSGASGSLVNGASGATGALIEAFAYGVIMTAGSVTNYASIIASSQATPTWGVDIETTGTVGNLGSVGLIEGYGGVRIGANGTIINVGTIASNQGAGGVAVDFVGGNARLIDNPGAVFVGSITGGTGGTAVLELASAVSAGTIVGLGSTVTNFTSLVFDTGAQWTAAGNDNANGLGTLGISGFTIGDTFDLTGFVAVSDTFASNTLVLTNGVGDHESLDIQGAFVSDNFHLASDGNGGTDISFVTPPTIAAGGTVTFTGGGSPVTLDSTLGITSPDSTTLVSGTVSIGGFLSGDTLNFTDQDGITGSFDSATGSLTLTGSATLADYQAALDSITYGFTPADGDPAASGDTTRTIAWVVNDGTNASTVATSTLDTVHVAPTIIAGGTVSFTGGGGAVVLDSTLTVADPDSAGLLNAGTVSIGGFLSGDTLNFTDQDGIVGSFDTLTGTLTLTGSATLADYQAALDWITYGFNPADGDPTATGDTTRTINWQVDDGTSASTVATSTLDTGHVAPTITADGTVSFTGGGSAVTLDSTLTLTDPDSGGLLNGGTVSVGGFLSGDTLNFTDQNGITGSFNGATGALTLTGSATLADYQAALDSITYSFNPTDGDPTGGVGGTNRTIDWVVTDGASANGVSNTGTSTLDIVRVGPTITAGGTVGYVADGPPSVLDPDITITDVDSAGVIHTAMVSIGGGFTFGDLLNFTDQNGITGAYDSATGTLTLGGNATIADYQAALDSITYAYTPAGGDPTAAGTDPTRAISWTVDDGVDTSAAAFSTLDLSLPPPVITGTVAGQRTSDNVPIQPFSGVTIGDPNTGAIETVTITLTDGGTPTDADGTLSGTGLTETGTGTYTLAAGTPDAVTAALDALVFTPTLDDVIPYGTITTGMTLSVTDNLVGTPAADDTTTTVNSIACFAAGTRIATPRGAVAVERLREGDMLLTVSGKPRPVQWIGRRTLDCTRHITPERVKPVRIAPHAFGEDRPKRPLLLSPDHSVFIEDVMIPIKHLINGVTITQLDVATVTSYHIELESHDVILAEGLPAETYLETGGRAAFENGGGAIDLHPDFEPDENRVGMVWQNFAYAPLIGNDGQLNRVRTRLTLQAAMLQHQASATPPRTKRPRRSARA